MLTATTGNVSACTRPPGGSFTGCAIENVSGDGTPTQFANVGLDAQGNAVAAWVRKLPNGTGTFAVESGGRPSGALTWTPLGTFSETGVDLDLPTLAVSDQGAAILAWRRGMERIDGASRVAGAAFGPSQPLSAAAGNPVFPDVAMDLAGNGAAAWERIPPADTVVEVAGFDGAGPMLSGLSIPARGDTGKPLAFAVAATDVWSPVQSIDWTFGDGGPVPGTQVSHTYGGVGGNLTVSVTASDSLGNATTATSPIRIRDTIRPVLSRLRMTHRRFAVGRARTPLVARRVPRGSAFRFRLSERAKVTIRLERRVGRRYRKVKTLTRRGLRGGANTVRFSGRIKRKALPSGAYRAKLRAVDRLVEQANAVVGLALHRGRQEFAEALVQHRLRGGHSITRRARERLGPPLDARIELLRGHHLGGEAARARPLGVAWLAAEEQLARGGLAEDLRQQQGARVARHQADPDLRGQEPHAVAAQPEVAARRELERSPHAHAVDHGGHRHGGGEDHARHPLEALDGRLPGGRVCLDRGMQVVPGREVLARSAHGHHAHGRVAASFVDRVGDRAHRGEVPSVAAILAVPGDHPRRAEVGGRDCHRAGSFFSMVSTASGSGSPRAVRWTIRVLCSATGSDPGSSRVTSKRARSAEWRRSATFVRSASSGASTYSRSGGTTGSPSATTQWRPRPGAAPRIALIACG